MGNTMTSAEVCELLGVDRSTLVRWVQLGRLEATYKFPGRNGAYLFDRDVIHALARDRGVQVPAA